MPEYQFIATKCHNCGDGINNADNFRIWHYIDRNGLLHYKSLCKFCFENLFSSCPHCGLDSVSTAFVKTDSGVHVCEACIKTLYVTCRACHKPTLKSEATLIAGEWFSPQFASQYAECDECHCLITSRDAQQYGGVCMNCLRGVVLDWNAKIDGKLDFLVTPSESKGKNTRYFGVELEVEHNSGNDKGNNLYQTARAVRSFFNAKKDPFVMIKHDGSLENGFEIVTAPATYGVHEAWWNEFFKTYGERGEMSSRYTTTCGMHVHISKNSLTQLQIGKILVFICAHANRHFIKAIAGRDSNRYNNFTHAKRLTDAYGGTWIANEGRYTAVNLMNANTVEIRLFKGTLDKSKFFKNMEFVTALVEYCAIGNCSINDVKEFGGFVKFVSNASTVYPNLFKFLVDTGYCTYKSKRPIAGKRRSIKGKINKRKSLVSVDKIEPNANGKKDCKVTTTVFSSNSDRKYHLTCELPERRRKLAKR
jgi:hypothetical protein